MRRMDGEHPLVEHHLQHHGSVEQDGQEVDISVHYKMKAIRFMQSPLSRQALEGSMISKYKGDIVLNRKGEWGNNTPPTLTPDDSERKRKIGDRERNVAAKKARRDDPPPPPPPGGECPQRCPPNPPQPNSPNTKTPKSTPKSPKHQNQPEGKARDKERGMKSPTPSRGGHLAPPVDDKRPTPSRGGILRPL